MDRKHTSRSITLNKKSFEDVIKSLSDVYLTLPPEAKEIVLQCGNAQFSYLTPETEREAQQRMEQDRIKAEVIARNKLRREYQEKRLLRDLIAKYGTPEDEFDF